MPESEILLKYTTDKGALSQTLAAEKQVTAAQQELLDLEKRLAEISTAKQTQALDLTRKALEQLKAEMAGLEGDELKKAQVQALKYEEDLQKVLIQLQKQKVAEEAVAEAARRKAEAEQAAAQAALQPSTRPGVGGAAGAGRFENVSKQVGIYGDVESQVRTLTGALGYMGGAAGQTAEQIINVGAELFAVREAGPKLAAALGDIAVNISETSPLIGTLSVGFQALIPALGTTGAAIAAVALPVAAVVAVIGGLVLAIKSIGDAAEAARKQADEQYNASKRRIEIEREIADFQRENDKQGAQARLDELKRQQEDANKLLTEIYVARDEIDKAYRELGASLNPDERAKLGAQGQERQKQLEEETKLFQERQKEIDALEAAIPSIQDASAEEQKLAEQRDQTVNATDTASQAESSRQKAIDDAQRQIEQAQEKAQAAQDNYNKAVSDAAITARNAAQDIRTKLTDAIADLATKARRQAIDDTLKQNADLYDIRLSQFRAEQDALVKHGRALRDAIKNANRSQEDLLAERDFLALDKLSKSTERQLEDAQQTAEDAAQDRAVANRNELIDFQTQSYRLRGERIADYQRQFMDLRTNSERELRDAQIAKGRQLEQARNALQQELDMARRGVENKLQLEAQYWQQSMALIPKAGSGGGETQRNVLQNEILNMLKSVRVR